MRIGVDFDNTIADYDDVFVVAAQQTGLLRPGFSGGKQAVRAALRALPDGEEKWMRLQGKAYGTLMSQARMIDGFDAFLSDCADLAAEVYVVSHKTEYGHFDEEHVNLRDAARCWMDAHDFDRRGLPRDRVFFEASRAEKIARIKTLGCSHYIDDLEEVFREPAFPQSIDRYLLSRTTGDLPRGPFTACRSWNEIRNAVFR